MVTTDALDELAALQDLLDARVSIVRVIVDETGKEIGRIYRGSFTRTPDSQTSEPHSEGVSK